MVTSIVLAGGKGLRLSRSKPAEIIGGKSLIQRVVERLKGLSSQILIVISQEPLDLLGDGEIEIVKDIYPGKGPLGGIYTGLMASRSSHNLVVACDMPFINIELVRYMIELSPDFDVVVPRLEKGKVEPLHAVYSKSCLNPIRSQLERDQLRIACLLDTLNVRYVERAECQSFDPELLSFFNINCQSDLDRASKFAVRDKY